MSQLDAPRLKVFLVHASDDKPFVRLLYQKLLADGVEPWFDDLHLLPGQHLRDEIRNVIRHADAVVICLSRASTTKPGFVQWEMAVALDAASEHPERSIFLIPALIEPCEIPSRLQHLQAPTIHNEAGYLKLVEALRARAAKLGRTFTPRRPEPGARRDESPARDSLTPEAMDPYIQQAFLQTFWERSVPTAPRRTDRFTVSLVGGPGVGKTTLAFVLTHASLGLLDRTTPRTLPWDYHLPYGRGIVVADHPAWSAGAACWGEVLKYVEVESDLVLFLVGPDRADHAEAREAFAQVERLSAPVALVANKVDLLRGLADSVELADLRRTFDRSPLPVSAGRGIGLRSLRKIIDLAPRMYG